jgi:hypothetical protein
MSSDRRRREYEHLLASERASEGIDYRRLFDIPPDAHEEIDWSEQDQVEMAASFDKLAKRWREEDGE